MKTKLSLLLLVSCFFCLVSLNAQVPQGFNYQAVARLTTGDPIINTTLPVRITIQADSLGTAIIWQELHSSVTTNGFGLLTLILGKGARQAASTVATFNAIDWTVTPKFIKTEINYSGWKTMGVTRFWSVPYAKIAENLGGPVKKLAVTGTTLINDEALFEVKNKDGYTVFAVYNEGVRVYVSDGAKGLKGGFAVGGFGTDKAESTKYLFVGKDSVRIYLDTNPLTKKLKGGFAVGGYDLTKGIVVQDYLDVNSDSVRIYIDSNPATKKLKGGFAVGGYDMTKGTNTNYMNVNTDASGIISPSQNRILWYPIKNAFLTGKVLIESSANVGENSFASGFESKAKGDWSQALGFKAIANGNYSTAIGKNAVADSINSFAFGESAKASGNQSYAFGYNAKAEAKDAFALGRGARATGIGSFALGFIGKDSIGNITGNTFASDSFSVAIGMGAQAKKKGSFSIGTQSITDGEYSLSMGYKAVASSYYSISIGAYAEATGYHSTAIGYSSTAKGTGAGALNGYAKGTFATACGSSYSTADFSTASGYGFASGLGSTAFGYDVHASGNYSFSTGNGSTASGLGSVSLGDHSNASGDYSLAAGYYCSATNLSWAGGYNSQSTGIGSFAFGASSKASGTSAFSIGNLTTASGRNSSAFGSNTTSQSLDCMTTGSFNIISGDSENWIATDPLFVIGNGTSLSARSNALTVLKNGNAGIGTTAPSYKLHVNGTFYASSVQIGNSSGAITPNWWEFGVDNGGGTGIDFHSNASATDYSVRIYRNPGNNGEFQIVNTGTGSLSFFTQNLSRMTINSTGYTGIGTTAPIYPLHVATAALVNCPGYGYLNSAGTTGTSSGSNYYSIFAENRIRAEEFNADSDIRIKKIIGISDSENDLDILKKIKVTDFIYLDSISKGNIVHKKVIAQELKEIFPNAVTATISFVPSIYAKPASIQFDIENHQMVITMPKEHGLKKGDNVKFIEPEGAWNEKVTMVISPNTFCVNSSKNRDRLFVYGKEVNDFLTVDYEAISMLNVSATQELVKKMEEQKEEISSLNEKIVRLENAVEEMKLIITGSTGK